MASAAMAKCNENGVFNGVMNGINEINISWHQWRNRKARGVMKSSAAASNQYQCRQYNGNGIYGYINQCVIFGEK